MTTEVATRSVEIRCKACGCIEPGECPTGVEISGRTWQLIRGYGALLRYGGCDADCRCHVEYRAEYASPFSITFGPKRQLREGN